MKFGDALAPRNFTHSLRNFDTLAPRTCTFARREICTLWAAAKFRANTRCINLMQKAGLHFARKFCASVRLCVGFARGSCFLVRRLADLNLCAQSRRIFDTRHGTEFCRLGSAPCGKFRNRKCRINFAAFKFRQVKFALRHRVAQKFADRGAKTDALNFAVEISARHNL